MKINAKTILSVLLAAVMMFSCVACDKDENPNGGGGGTGTNSDATTTTAGGENNADLPEGAQDFDFGVLAFGSREFEVPDGDDVKIGGNLNGEGGGGESAIHQFGFQGYAKPGSGYPEIDGVFSDPDGLYCNLVSQNGEFWDNISKIEVDFFLEGVGGAESENIGNIERYIQRAGLMGYQFKNDGENQIETYVDKTGEDFDFGSVLNITWDIDAWKANEENRMGYFGDDEDETDCWLYESTEESGWKGGGILKFGLMISNDDVLGPMTMKIHFTDVKIYVHDMEKYQAYVDEVLEITGGEVSSNTAGKVIQA